ncbi:MAG: DegQ family serine endoprotease [Syntrophaceae bacterium]|nr:DegQ family serine endoprotease [Syntrophaceae bacterium]
MVKYERKASARQWVFRQIRVVLLVLCAIGFTFPQAIAASAVPVPMVPSFADLSEQLSPTVVNISTTKILKSQRIPRGNIPFDFFGNDEFFRRFFGDRPEREYRQNSLGSGFIISSDGYIFTNNHVVEKADKIKVKLSDGHEYDGEVKGKDANTDIALIKIQPSAPLKAVTFGDSDAIRIGDWVFAIGNPFGLDHTVTAGIISAKGRVIGSGPYDNFLQTDASINPGNSGGPLFNLKGEVIGINTAIVAHGQGIGFAIPINMAKEILSDLKVRGYVTRGWLGVSAQDVTEDIAKNLQLKEAHGALVGQVFEGEPAAKGGIRAGDVILEIAGKPIGDLRDLLLAVASLPVGKKVDVKIWRDGKDKILPVVIAERKDSKELTGKDTLSETFGMSVQEITPEIMKQLKLKSSAGLIITDVEDGSPAGDAGLQPRDIILEINRQPIESLEDFTAILSQKTEGNRYLFRIKRDESFFFVVLTKPEEEKP